MKRIEILIDRVDGRAVTQESLAWRVRVRRDGKVLDNHLWIPWQETRVEVSRSIAHLSLVWEAASDILFCDRTARRAFMRRPGSITLYQPDLSRLPDGTRVVPCSPKASKRWWQKRTTSVPFGAFWGKKRR